MRVSFALTALGFLRDNPPANLLNIRQQLFSVENDPQLFSHALNQNIQALLSQTQHYEAALLIHYFKNRGSSSHAVIDAATNLITNSSADDAKKDFVEYYLLGTLAFIINSVAIPAFAPPKDLPEEAHVFFVGLKSIFGALILSAFLLYKRGNMLEKISIEQKNATTSDQFTRAFVAQFIEKFPSLFENGTATVGSDQVRFEFQIKAANENASDFHTLLVSQPAVAAQCIENAFGAHLINVMPDPNDSAKIQIMVSFRSAEQCQQLVKQMNLPFFNLDSLNQAAMRSVAVSYNSPGQGGPR